jgi:hypothetical protein
MHLLLNKKRLIDRQTLHHNNKKNNFISHFHFQGMQTYFYEKKKDFYSNSNLGTVNFSA